LKDEPDLPDITVMTEPQSEVCLQEYGFLPGLPPAVTRLCWNCKARGVKSVLHLSKRHEKINEAGEVARKAEDVLKCGKKTCKRHFPAKTSYTPMHNTVLTFNMYLRISWCFAYGETQSRTMKLTKGKEDQIQWVFSALRDITAWFIVSLGRGVVFETAEVDMDACKSHVQRSDPDKSVHTGRLFVYRERATRKRKVFTLPDKDVPKGSALPPESNREIKWSVTETLKSGAIAGADGGLAIASSVRASAGGKVPLSIAIHSKKTNEAVHTARKVEQN
jgi:hypothetical protein